MITPVLRRLFSGLAAVMLASLLAFLILEASPGDVLSSLLGDEATLEQTQALRSELGLDEPLHLRYLHFLTGLMHGDLGVSIVHRRPVAQLIGQRFLNTLLLTSLSIILAIIAGFGLGIWAALRHKSRSDMAVLAITAFCLALPTFGIAIFLTQVFSVRLGWLPSVGGGTARHFVLPCIVLAIPTAAVIARVMRARLIEELQMPYVLTAQAKGLNQSQIWRAHALRNALVPALTLVGVQFGHLLAGAFIVETIFAWPGLGRLAVQAIFEQDYPVVLGAVVLSAVVFQVCNALVDIAHLQIDPRIRPGN